MPTTYIYTVTDANNCTSSNSQQITQPNQLEVSADIVNNLCHGDTNGSIDITISVELRLIILLGQILIM